MNNALKAGQVVAGKYRIEGVLGAGGMGVVLAARHVDLRAPRAIKVPHLHGAAHEELTGQLLREAHLAAQLTGEHVVRIHDAGRLESGAPYIVMEQLEGSDLEEILRRHGRLPVGDAALYVMQACAGMEEAHALGIVHRDLKPANLFLTARSDGSPCLKVLDFGIAQSVDVGSPSGKHQVEGSPAYMAPEQTIAGPVADARADIWALGVILYELLTGRTPFSGDSVAATFSLIMGSEPAPAETLRPDLPAGIAAILSRCLQKSPARRFQRVAELRAALAPFASTGGGAEPPSTGDDGCHEAQARERIAVAETRRSPSGPWNASTVETTLPARGEPPRRRIPWTAWMASAGALFDPGVDPLHTLVGAGLGALRYVGDRLSAFRRDDAAEGRSAWP